MSFDATSSWTAGPPPPPPPPPRRNGPIIAAIVAAVAVVAALVVGTAVLFRDSSDDSPSDVAQPDDQRGATSAVSLSPSAPAAASFLATSAAPLAGATVTVTAAPPVTVTAPAPVTITAPPPVTVVVPAPAQPPVYRSAAGDLGLSVPMTRPACDGLGIVLLFSSTEPGAYASEIQQALRSFPGSSYLRTDQSCPSLTQYSDAGNPIYSVYRPAGYTAASVCAAVSSSSGNAYGKWLDYDTPADATVDC